MDFKDAPLPPSFSKKLLKADYKLASSLDQQRKAGTLPALIDPFSGKDINPHVPTYISDAPWYLDINQPTLLHQQSTKLHSNNNQWYPKGHNALIHKKITSFRKGACENCGAITHKKSACLERPRKIPSKYNPTNLAKDEVITSLNLSYDQKRDRWNGYDPNDHLQVVEDYQILDEMRREFVLQSKLSSNDITSSTENAQSSTQNDSSSNPIHNDDDEFKYAEDSEMVGQKMDVKNRTTVRNLRIREDTAKYLLNLDLDSAHYDPKTRSMRDDPGKGGFAGDNFVRYTGEVSSLSKAQLFAWSTSERINALPPGLPDTATAHLQANPTHNEKLYKEFIEAKKKTTLPSVLERYGGHEHLLSNAVEVSEVYTEYTPAGKVVESKNKPTVVSRYMEDVFPGNHTSIWGSFWKDGKWGYSCCFLHVKAAWCTGESGKLAASASNVVEPESSSASENNKPNEELKSNESSNETKRGDGAKERASTSSRPVDALNIQVGSRIAFDKRKLDDAMKSDTKSVDIGAEDLEAYRLKKISKSDPMFEYLNKSQ